MAGIKPLIPACPSLCLAAGARVQRCTGAPSESFKSVFLGKGGLSEKSRPGNPAAGIWLYSEDADFV